jgi:hypothetical protein
MNGGTSPSRSSIPPASGPVSARARDRKRGKLYVTMASIGASAQAAIPGLYAWAITVAPAAWSRGAPFVAKGTALVGVIALVTAPIVEGAGPALSPDAARSVAFSQPANLRARAAKRSFLQTVRSWTGPTWARAWSVWGFVLSSAMVWALVPTALSSARLDGVRGALGMIGWALFAFASAGPALRSDPSIAARIVASTSLKPRSEIPRGDGLYVGIGVVLALSMQAVGWGIPVPERAVLVRLVTVVCGIAVLGGTTSIALARHSTRVPASRRVRLKRALPWLVMLALVSFSGAILGILR